MIPMSNHQSENLLYLGLIGLPKPKEILVNGLCRLSKSYINRSRESRYVFQISDANNSHDIGLYVIDSDQKEPDEARKYVDSINPNTPILFLGEAPPKDNLDNEYSISYKDIASELPKLLNHISTNYYRQAEVIDEELEPSKTCLIVDDSQLMRAKMELVLKELHLLVECAEDAEKALVMTQDKHYDIIFLDVVLPEMDGYQACKRIKSNANSQDTPVVMLTSKSSPFNKMRGVIAGCDRYLTKPVDLEDVHKVLRKYTIID